MRHVQTQDDQMWVMVDSITGPSKEHIVRMFKDFAGLAHLLKYLQVPPLYGPSDDISKAIPDDFFYL